MTKKGIACGARKHEAKNGNEGRTLKIESARDWIDLTCCICEKRQTPCEAWGPRAPEANARFTVEKARRGPKGLMTTSTLGSLVQFEDPLKSIQDSFVVVSRERCKKHTM